MHKLITGYAQTDHINHDGLDNTRANLRPVTAAQNAQNKRPQEGGASRYRGVTWDRGKWRAVIHLNRVPRHLGSFDREEDAADAYDRAALEMYGEYAYLNNARTGAAA
jgi:AP2 domain